MAISAELERLLSSWLPRQPWFPKHEADFGADPDITPMSVAHAFDIDAGELGQLTGWLAVISVGEPSLASDPVSGTGSVPEVGRKYPQHADAAGLAGAGTAAAGGAGSADGDLRRLNVPLSLRSKEDFRLRPHLIGVVDDITLGKAYVYDGAADPVFVSTLAAAIAEGATFDGAQLRAHRVSTGTHGLETIDPTQVPIELSDSRTDESLVVLHHPQAPCTLTFFRKIRPGMPSAVKVPVALTEIESASVPEVLGWAEGRWFDTTDLATLVSPLAILERIDPGSRPAWKEAVEIACAVDSGSIHSYNRKATELGNRIGELHLELAAEFGVVDSTGEPAAELVKKWIDRVDWALARAPLALNSLATQLRAHRDELTRMQSVGMLQRIHGELTLNQVVAGPATGFRVINFSAATHDEPKPAAIDLVALLRSIDYAAGYARLRRIGALDVDATPTTLGFSGLDTDGDDMRAVLDSPEYLWSSQAQNALLSGYAHATETGLGFESPVLRAVLIDRLLVETVTELRNRPTWLIVPLATLNLLLKGRPARPDTADGEEHAEGEPASAAEEPPTESSPDFVIPAPPNYRPDAQSGPDSTP